ncbi:xanthine dehydrogenase family protein subunit M [Nonomuraea sp. FMUSA5-5]|uniref:Xanthine dehydrogenase family protein subunit M n=1 Tax=Nonomuraea composti TaxID=2720023 RepID=A0ABX1BEG2_9ACTN|nr:xanthine dehydrogenase family protein subunit M [Nonomuraea sp. FMUSA5-5]
MKPPPFAYRRPASVQEALTLAAQAGEDAKFIAGGQSLMPLLALRMSRPSHLIDINRLPGLDELRQSGAGLRVGALVRHATLERDARLTGPWRALREAAALIGHHPIRLRGTFGGSAAHADPSAELPVVAVAMDATFVVRSTSGEREILACDFFAGPLMTVLDPAELLVEARFPAPPPRTRSAFEEFAPRAGDFAFASTAVTLSTRDDGTVQQARIALGGVDAVPVRAYEAEQALEGEPLTDATVREAAGRAAAGCTPSGDAHASATYRRQLIATLVERALSRLKEER